MKNKLLHFALDLFSASDDEEQDSIFAQVKIYRTASVRIFEYIIGILLLAIWLLTIVNITHVAAEEWHSCLIVAIFGTSGYSTGLSSSTELFCMTKPTDRASPIRLSVKPYSRGTI